LKSKLFEIMNIRFDKKTVLVTGASRGIGKAIAHRFADAGAKVIVHCNSNKEKAEKVASVLKGTGHYTVQADISSPKSVQEMLHQIMERSGKLDVLINNAGVYEEIDWDSLEFDGWQKTWKKIMDINLTGVSNLCFLVAKLMEKNGGGSIVNISSRGAFRGEPTAPAYGASKAGLNAMGQSLAKALASRKIFVYTIAPGWVDTDMAMDGMQGENAQMIKDQSPLKRIATPDEIAQAAIFLASGNEFMTGCILDINGASYLRT
jgi:NAD(P)-dependent dehydrogenase (short-subunit alcohol dehydrogenase family)